MCLEKHHVNWRQEQSNQAAWYDRSDQQIYKLRPVTFFHSLCWNYGVAPLIKIANFCKFWKQLVAISNLIILIFKKLVDFDVNIACFGIEGIQILF
jgi:hypothetical protein